MVASETLPSSNLRHTAKVDFSRPLDYSTVKGKTVVVQDGAAGLGLGIATGLAENGAKVAIFDHSIGNCAGIAKELTDRGFSVRSFYTKSSDWDSQLESFKRVLEWSDNQLDIVITSPGIVTNNLMLSILPKHRKPGADPIKPPTNTLEVDLMGVYFATSLALFYFNKFKYTRLDPAFQPQLLFICSMAGVRILSKTSCLSDIVA